MQFGFEAHTQDHGVPFRIALTPQVGWTCPWCTVRSLSHLAGSKAISDQANCHPVWFFGPLPISEYVVLGSTPFGVFWSSQFWYITSLCGSRLRIDHLSISASSSFLFVLFAFPIAGNFCPQRT